MKNSKSFSLFQVSFWILSLALILVSCNGGGKPNPEPPKPTEGGTFQEIQVLGKIKPGKPGWIVPNCCICVTEPCPCRCIPFDGIKVGPRDVISTAVLNLTDNEKEKLTLYTIKTNDASVIKEARNHDWVGLLHNEVVSRTVSKMDKPITAWKDSKKKPTDEEMLKSVEEALLETYKEIGFSGEVYTVAEKATKETLRSTSQIDRTKFSSVMKAFEKLESGASPDDVRRESGAQENALNAKMNSTNASEFYQNKMAFSVMRASSDLWTASYLNSLHIKYTGVRATDAELKVARKDLVDQDVRGAVIGAATGPGAATGAAAGSAAELVSRLIKWLF